MWVGRGTLALASAVPWRSEVVGVENVYFNSIKPKIHLNIFITFTTDEHYIPRINTSGTLTYASAALV